MNADHRDAFLAAFRRKATTEPVAKRTSVALPLAIVVVALVGLALVEWGLWPMCKPAAVIIGVIVAAGMPRVFSAVWGTRR